MPKPALRHWVRSRRWTGQGAPTKEPTDAHRYRPVNWNAALSCAARTPTTPCKFGSSPRQAASTSEKRARGKRRPRFAAYAPSAEAQGSDGRAARALLCSPSRRKSAIAPPRRSNEVRAAVGEPIRQLIIKIA